MESDDKSSHSRETPAILAKPIALTYGCAHEREKVARRTLGIQWELDYAKEHLINHIGIS